MKIKIIGILVCISLLFVAVLPVTSKSISKSVYISSINGETSVKVFYIVKFDLIGKGEVSQYSTAVFWNITEGEANTSSILFFELDDENIISINFFEHYTIIGPASGTLMFFVGTVNYIPETKNVEIHGSAIMGISGPTSD